MKLLFIQGGSRVKEDEKGNLYTDANFNDKVWNRYLNLCDSLTVVLRKENKVYKEDFAIKKFNKFDISKLHYVPVEDIMRPKKNYFNFIKRKKIKSIIENEVKNCDCAIVRSPGSYYCKTAIKYCKKYEKKYLVEITGFAFEGIWNHSFAGKFVAVQTELLLRKLTKDASCAIYVTNEALQKRYPCKNAMLGCSDVEIYNVVDKHEKSFNTNEIHIGTAAFLDVAWKGQKDVIKALHKMKSTNIYYHLVGAGSGDKLKKLVKKYHLEKYVIFEGTLTHDKIYDWYKKLDCYVQPSYQEGLCRAIVEAMSMGCPVICTNIGGNYELVSKDCLYKKKNINELISLVAKINKEFLDNNSKLNIETSKKYMYDVLDKKRDEFYKEFIKSIE